MKLLQQIFRLEILKDCKDGRIPSIVVHPILVVLLTDLKEIENTLNKDQREVARSSTDISSLYQLNIHTCAISQSTILVTVRIPIHKINQLWSLLLLDLIPFAR